MAYLKSENKNGTAERTAYISKSELSKTIRQCLSVFSRRNEKGIQTFIYVDVSDDFERKDGECYSPGIDVIPGDYYRIQVQKTNIGINILGWVNDCGSYQLRQYSFTTESKMIDVICAMSGCTEHQVIELFSKNDSCLGRSEKTYYQAIY